MALDLRTSPSAVDLDCSPSWDVKRQRNLLSQDLTYQERLSLCQVFKERLLYIVPCYITRKNFGFLHAFT